jgi:hypothetical protein
VVAKAIAGGSAVFYAALMNRSRPSQKPSAARPQVKDDELSLKPEYALIPPCGLVVLESRHAPGWATPSWFDEDFNKFVLIVSGKGRLKLPDRVLALGKDKLYHAMAHTPHLWEDLPGEPLVNYVIHYRPHVLPSEVVRDLSAPAIIHWNLKRIFGLSPLAYRQRGQVGPREHLPKKTRSAAQNAKTV